MNKFYVLKNKKGEILYELSASVYRIKDAIDLSNLCGGLVIAEKSV